MVPVVNRSVLLTVYIVYTLPFYCHFIYSTVTQSWPKILRTSDELKYQNTVNRMSVTNEIKSERTAVGLETRNWLVPVLWVPDGSVTVDTFRRYTVHLSGMCY